jgi:hypothetical protein
MVQTLPQPTLFRWTLIRLATLVPAPTRLPTPDAKSQTEQTQPLSLSLKPDPLAHLSLMPPPPALLLTEAAYGKASALCPNAGPGPATCCLAAAHRPLLISRTAINIFLIFPQLTGWDPAPTSVPHNQVVRIALESALSVFFQVLGLPLTPL